MSQKRIEGKIPPPDFFTNFHCTANTSSLQTFTVHSLNVCKGSGTGCVYPSPSIHEVTWEYLQLTPMFYGFLTVTENSVKTWVLITYRSFHAERLTVDIGMIPLCFTNAQSIHSWTSEESYHFSPRGSNVGRALVQWQSMCFAYKKFASLFKLKECSR